MSNYDKNKRYSQEPIHKEVKEPIAIEKAPIEEAPVAVEKVEEKPIENKEVSEIKKEEKINNRPVLNKPAVQKMKGEVLLITRDGCIVATKEKGNLSLYGEQYKSYKKGDIIEF